MQNREHHNLITNDMVALEKQINEFKAHNNTGFNYTTEKAFSQVIKKTPNHFYGFFEIYQQQLDLINIFFRDAKKKVTTIESNLPYKINSNQKGDYLTDIFNIAHANLTLGDFLTKRYNKPKFKIYDCMIDGKIYLIKEKIICSKNFCNLLHFEKQDFTLKQEKLLIIAPMAGHYATLLYDTVKTLLPNFDVYITDWLNARDVPISKGYFNMDDFIDYIIEFSHLLSPNLNIMAVCQPTVPTIAAVSLIEQEKQKNQNLIKSMILMGGPVDARANPTLVNEFATSHDYQWFEKNSISLVPQNYKGAGRFVYPGALQLAGFMSLNLSRHTNSYLEMWQNIINQDIVAFEKKYNFYHEYLAVMDLTAEFYLQTIKEVFQNFSLAKNNLISRGRKIDTHAIKDVALLVVEGELDDIAAVGQTKAALDLCANIPDNCKKYHMQKSVGHYGVFSGSKFRKYIAPEIKNFVYNI